MRTPIRTLAHRERFIPADILNEHLGPVVACDFYIEGAELAREIPGGYEIDGVMNIDHHAPALRMMRHVSSTNLAIDQVNQAGKIKPGGMVFVSHTDCDSVLSSAIMAGELEPEERFGEAAIAADHTGVKNEIADVLQSLEPRRDLYFSLRNLRKLMDGQPLDWTAQPFYADRLRKREAAENLVAKKKVHMDGPLAHAVLDMKIDGELLPAKLPEAALILLLSARTDSSRWDAKIRLGNRAPTGASLRQLRMKRFDPAFVGRWNAGSNARNGGTDVRPEEYIRHVSSAMREAWEL
ncbi:MAG TPA: hypothetical protein VFD22_09155 [Gemmatimonadaceae bacterium]|jgi:hypothetical protein|nr:hypothetical protein [Gemmatimonadaceae bacterium]